MWLHIFPTLLVKSPSLPILCNFLFLYIKLWLTYNMVLVSGVQLQILFRCRLLQDTDYSSTCYTCANPCLCLPVFLTSQCEKRLLPSRHREPRSSGFATPALLIPTPASLLLTDSCPVSVTGAFPVNKGKADSLSKSLHWSSLAPLSKVPLPTDPLPFSNGTSVCRNLS